MSTSTTTASTTIRTGTGDVTFTLLDRVSVDRVAVSLVRNAIAARFYRRVDDTAPVSREVKDTMLFPFTEP